VRFYFSFFFFLFLTVSLNAQIDSRNNSISIPAIESPKDSSSSKSIVPIKPIENPNTYKGLTTPNTTTTPQFNFPRKEFSMMGGEVFGNPGDLYTKQLDKHMDNVRQEMYLGTKGSDVDVYFGEVKTTSEYVMVQYRDYGAQDGDLIRISVNDEIIEFRVYLTNAFKGFRLDLKEGYNKIDFLALNEGTSMPNTAHFRIIDDQQKTLVSDQWALSTNVKATINVFRVPKEDTITAGK
jgi:hypothetical protein